MRPVRYFTPRTQEPIVAAQLIFSHKRRERSTHAFLFFVFRCTTELTRTKGAGQKKKKSIPFASFSFFSQGLNPPECVRSQEEKNFYESPLT